MILVICVEEIVRQFSKFVKATKFLSIVSVPDLIYNSFSSEAMVKILLRRQILPFPFLDCNELIFKGKQDLPNFESHNG